MTDKSPITDQQMDVLFEEAAGFGPEPSSELLGRVLADAYDVRAPVPELTPRKVGLWDTFLSAIGGWPSIGGLATAAMAGVWIGFAPTDTFSDFTGTYLSNTVTTYDVGDLMPSIISLDEEG